MDSNKQNDNATNTQEVGIALKKLLASTQNYANLSDQEFQKLKKKEILLTKSATEIDTSSKNVAWRMSFGLPAPSQSTFSHAPQAGKTAIVTHTQTPETAASSSQAQRTLPIRDSVSSSNNEVSKAASKRASDPPERTETQLGQPRFSDEEYAKTTAFGAGGVNATIRVNRFAIEVKLLPVKLYVYNIAFPDVDGKEVKTRRAKKLIIKQIIANSWSTAFGENKIFTDYEACIVTVAPLQTLSVPSSSDDSFVVDVDLPWSRAGAVKVQANIKPRDTLARVDLEQYLSGQGPQTFDFSKFTDAFNIMARHFTQDTTIRVGRTRIFEQSPAAGSEPLKSGLQVRYGFHNSVRPAHDGLHLQLQSSATGFFPDCDLHKLVQQYFPLAKKTNMSADERRQLCRMVNGILRHLQVRPKYISFDPKQNPTGRSNILSRPTDRPLKRIFEVGDTADKVFFKHSHYTAKSRWSVQEHFEKHVLSAGTVLTQKHLPLVNTGSKQEPVWIPMELLWIEPHQAHRGPVPSKDVRDMANLARKLPQESASHIHDLGLNLLRADDLISTGTLPLKTSMLTIKGRVLPPPKLLCKSGHTPSNKGKWDLENKKFNVSAGMPKLLVIKIGKASSYKDHAVFDKLAAGLKLYGLKDVDAETFVLTAANASSTELNKAWHTLPSEKRNSLRVILIVLEDDSPDTYSAVKYWGEVLTGINTVCVQLKKAGKLSQGDFQANLALKFNVKLGGTNFRLEDKFSDDLHRQGKMMIVGADVTHPGPGSIEGCPSVAAVVASVDKHFVKYPGSMRLQASRQEEIADLCGMMKERLQLFKQKSQGLPDKILFYRDGVSEDQYAMVKRKELAAIKKACNDMKPGYSPLITLVVCTKRHHTRFYPPAATKTGNNTILDHNLNFRPGLVVDDATIRLPGYFDFYLQAHAPIMGTGRPCYYFVLHNEIDLTPTILQQTTNKLSWIYATALTPVSLVAPVYYAHKLCDRARCYIRPLLSGNHPGRDLAEQELEQKKSAMGAGWERLTEEKKRETIADWFAEGMGKVWVSKGKNPCHAKVEDTMFFV